MTNVIDRAAHPGRFHINPKVVLIGGGGIAAFFVYRSYKNNAAATTTVDPNAVDPNAVDPNANSSDYGTGGFAPPHGVVPSAFDPYQIPTINNNQEWGAAAEKYLSTHGFALQTSTVAITKYLSGHAQHLTEAEYNAVEAAIVHLGEPPTKVGGPVKQPTHPPRPGPTVAGSFYRRLPDGSIWTVSGGKLYRVTPRTWRSFAHKPQLIKVIASNPIFRLPKGGNV